MPFQIVRNDITKMQVDAIVNTANPQPVVGAGTDAMIHRAAGPELLKARQAIGPIEMGQAALTPAFDLQARYVIHTVGPMWLGGCHDEEALLRSCYDRSLQLALESGCESIAFPLIASGNYDFPRDKALQIAISAFSEFLLQQDMQIYLVVFDRDSYKLSEKLFQVVASYIDENYVNACRVEAYAAAEEFRAARARRKMPLAKEMDMAELQVAPAKTLADALKAADIGFSESLLKRIDQTGKKDSEIYKKANISKQHFSKIRNNPDYKPTKATAIALALALELDLEQTKELIGRAGYALTNSSKFDLIIRFFIEQGNFNVVQINMALYEFDQPLLGM